MFLDHVGVPQLCIYNLTLIKLHLDYMTHNLSTRFSNVNYPNNTNMFFLCVLTKLSSVNLF